MYPPAQHMYDPSYEHDACGVGFVVNIDGTETHQIIDYGIQVLENLQHRGGAGGDVETGDGAGILVSMPDTFLRQSCSEAGIRLPEAGNYGVGMFFLPQEEDDGKRCRDITEKVVNEEGLKFLGWREVPVDSEAIGTEARKSQPVIVQCFIDGGDYSSDQLEIKLYVIRRQIELRVEESLDLGDRFYIPSLSSRKVVYKGLMMAPQIKGFYQDLNDPGFVSRIAVVHQRYSTNTFPSWKLAQPFRFLGHNGEINTLRGNKNHMASREKMLASDRIGEDIKKLLPVIDESGSDSACLDNVLELLVAGGRDLSHAMMMLIPQAWGEKYPIGPDLRGFFEYHAGMMEPWDGPAAVAFTDGEQVGALLDRNGLRPCRYTITRDGFMVMASETGVISFPPEEVAEVGALRPGEIILVDTRRGRVIGNKEIKNTYARRQPYRRWVEENKIALRGFFSEVSAVEPDMEKLHYRQELFGYTREDCEMILGPMAAKGKEPVGAMGYDAPLSVLSEKPQLLFSYFKQLFAQITNPAIDPIREELVMSLMTFMGNAGNILSEIPQNARLIKLMHPILSNDDLDRIRQLKNDHFKSEEVRISWYAGGGEEELENALLRLADNVEASVLKGRNLIILSDRVLPPGRVPIPSLLAVAAVNDRLNQKGLRTGTGIIVETGEAREIQHIALLLGYGATVVNPYLAFETIADLAARDMVNAPVSVAQAIENYIAALCGGLLKIMSKMGISTLRSYRNARVFEAVGLNKDLVDHFFHGTSSRIGGIGLKEIAEEASRRYENAQKRFESPGQLLPSGGRYMFRKDGERHLWTPESISTLQQATRTNDGDLYQKYAALINEQTEKQSTIRGLFRFRETTPIDLDQVEPAEEIMKRFVTGAMSFGSISREAHETLAIAMNRIGAKSNSGEGGEDPERYKPMENGDSRCSAIKQVASGRFGVTAEYLVNARELQIKIAQGAKPGEGGQLPGHKVNEEIAKVRHSTPGVTLISPPPHHDIYSIEDIKQLIFDLRNANPDARVSVKLVSEAGVGTVAAGVAKAKADMILISGYDGGTGASPLSSIQYAGVPWELGLSETQQTLMLNGLRGLVRIQADGQMKTGRDVVIAAMLGAEEFGFATVPLVICGCIMMRRCNENNCPVGVATQDPELRKRYKGKPEWVINFFRMLAEEVRRYMAQLGIRRMDDLVGRSDLLEMNKSISFWKAQGLDFSDLLHTPDVTDGRAIRYEGRDDYGLEEVLDVQLIEKATPSIENGTPVEMEFPVSNCDLAVGTMLSGKVAKKYGHVGLPNDTIRCTFRGSAGQSFAAFGAAGVTFELIGDANDYLGKGLSGAKVVVRPSEGVGYDPSDNIICGNVLLYGATSGEVYISGKVGERFAIRNSGVRAVVEGVGDHGCEYMTGGRIVILGETGVNFAAGMSGGIAYLYDPEGVLDGRCNLATVDLEPVVDQDDIEELKELISNHLKYTGSTRAKEILDDWGASLPSFVKAFPMEYRRVLGQMMKEDEDIEREEVTHG